ncbi:hypothetical protein ACXJJ3_26755 [Kribbella sp. WER1]
MTITTPRPAYDALPKWSAERQLADMLGQPHLAVEVASHLGPALSARLADRIRTVVEGMEAAVDRAGAALAGAASIAWEGLDGLPPECGTPEAPTCLRCGGELRWHAGMGVWQVRLPADMGWTDQCPLSSDRYHRHPEEVARG